MRRGLRTLSSHRGAHRSTPTFSARESAESVPESGEITVGIKKFLQTENRIKPRRKSNWAEIVLE